MPAITINVEITAKIKHCKLETMNSNRMPQLTTPPPQSGVSSTFYSTVTLNFDLLTPNP